MNSKIGRSAGWKRGALVLSLLAVVAGARAQSDQARSLPFDDVARSSAAAARGPADFVAPAETSGASGAVPAAKSLDSLTAAIGRFQGDWEGLFDGGQPQGVAGSEAIPAERAPGVGDAAKASPSPEIAEPVRAAVTARARNEYGLAEPVVPPSAGHGTGNSPRSVAAVVGALIALAYLGSKARRFVSGENAVAATPAANRFQIRELMIELGPEYFGAAEPGGCGPCTNCTNCSGCSPCTTGCSLDTQMGLSKAESGELYEKLEKQLADALHAVQARKSELA